MSYANAPPPGGGPYGAGSGYPPGYYYAPPPRNPWYKPVRRNANIACSCLIMVLLLGVFLSDLLTFVFDFFVGSLAILRPEDISLLEISKDFAVYLLMFIIPLSVMRLWIDIPAKIAFPMRSPRASIAFPAVLICIGSSILGAVILGVISTFIRYFFYVEPIVPRYPAPVGIPATVVYFVFLVLAPAVLEELMFRGVIMQSLRRFGDMFALICSSILFSLAHHNLVQGPTTFLVGLVIGFFTLRTGSLITAILMHFTNNLLAVVLEFLSSGTFVHHQEIFSFGVLAFYTVAGIAGLIMIISAHSGIFTLAPSNYPLYGAKKYAVFFFNFAPIIYIAVILALTAIQFQSASWY